MQPAEAFISAQKESHAIVVQMALESRLGLLRAFREGVNHLEAHLLANALCGPPVAPQKAVHILRWNSQVLGHLCNGFPLQPLSQQNRKLSRVDSGFPHS